MSSVVAQRASSQAGVLQETDRERLLAQAQGMEGVIRMGRGDPDLDTPEHIVRAAVEALQQGYTHYTHWAGMPELREAISDKLRRDNGAAYDPRSEVVVTTGVQQGIYVVFQTLLDPGDEVLIADPHYPSYDHAVGLAGGKLVYVPTAEEDDFALQPEAVEACVTPRTKVLVVVTPNNPTGAVIPEATLEGLARLAEKHNLVVISDEVYEKIIYDGASHVSIASLDGMRERTILFNGFSKAYSMTGWRLGYVAAPQDFVDKLQMLTYSISISANHAAQAGALAALEGGDACIERTVAIYDQRRRRVMEALDAMGLTYGHPGGAMYVFANIRPTGRSSYAFCKDLLHDARVQIFPGTAFGDGEGYVRISYLTPTEPLGVAMERMGEAVTRYVQGGSR